jgi:5-(aminomethyl)-3-furanmethanol phosphate kinase
VTDRSPLVVKIGGGLLQADGLAGLRRACAEAMALSRRRPVLVVPGGGPFADAVRAVDAQVSLGDDLAHALALQAMDQLGAMLEPLLGACAVAEELAPPPGLALLRAAPAFGARREIPRSWAVTSDSLAVFAAAAAGASEAILLKPVSPEIPVLTAAELEALQAQGGAQFVDAYLPRVVRDTEVAVTVRRPVAARGTRITPV